MPEFGADGAARVCALLVMGIGVSLTSGATCCEGSWGSNRMGAAGRRAPGLARERKQPQEM